MIVGRYFDCGPATRIAPKLWQGGLPANLNKLPEYGFDSIVLCSKELQPFNRPDLFPSGLRSIPVEAYCAPLNDVEDVSPQAARTAVEAAKHVVDLLDEGKRVLVSCTAGRNRSGLVVALVLVSRQGMSGSEAVEHVRSLRANALTNEAFCAFLRKISAGSGFERAA